MSYADFLKDHRWERRRKQIVERASGECERCGNGTSVFEVHHHRYRRDAAPWEYFDHELAALCPKCHLEITRLKRRLLDLLFLYEMHFLPLDRLVGYVATLVSELEPDGRAVLETVPAIHGAGDALGLPTREVAKRVEDIDSTVDVLGIREEIAKARSKSKVR